MKSSIAIVALVVTSIGLGAALPAVAQDATATPVAAQSDKGPGPGMHRMLRGDGMGRPGGMMRPGGMGGGAGGLIALACSDKGAEALDVALLHLSYRLQLTDAQKPLFDTFRTKALTTETSFADTCKASRPDTTADARPDMLARLKAGLAIDQARLTALNTVLPDFETLYDSLTDAQKQSITPRGQWSMSGDQDFGAMGHRDGGMGRMGRPAMPGRS